MHQAAAAHVLPLASRSLRIVAGARTNLYY